MVDERARRRVVVLRHPSRAVRIADTLARAGMNVSAMPLTDTELPLDVEAVARALASLARGDYRWFVVTSGNAVRALDLMARERTAGAARLAVGGGTGVAAVGSATARLLEEAGVAVDLVPAEASTRGLLRALGGGEGRIFLPQADLAPDDLRAGLTDLGWSVDRVEAYRTVPYPARTTRRVPGVVEDGVPPPLVSPADVLALAASGVQPAVVFTAPSTVEQFREKLGGGSLAFHPVAIGSTTAAALRGEGWEPGATASGPTPEAISVAVGTAFSRTPVILGPVPPPAPSSPASAPSAQSPAPASASPIGDQP
ncbi:uroporphyrinogen-III synthase [Arthrobacter agilis]|uniref:uroporphyrinogen-III synthase n=1 Tax=Arthrobacter agilis TaxID=37921 RepID=UPI002365B3E1|nr:uroporphyrinogen-III synthase [Arthrobacter agilis]WDF32461.1 uroporphyrinogen-III synthase [Arthrobacter agilis]